MKREKKDKHHISEYDVPELKESKDYVMVRGEKMSLGSYDLREKCSLPIKLCDSYGDSFDAAIAIRIAAEKTLRVVTEQCAEMFRKASEMDRKTWTRVMVAFGIERGTVVTTHRESSGFHILRKVEDEEEASDEHE